MIVPIIAIGLLALLAGHAMNASGDSAMTWHQQMTRFLSHVTLVGTGTDGLYNTQAIANTTPAITHVLNGVRDGQTVFVTSGGERVFFSSDGQPPRVGTWLLFAKPGGVIHR